MGQRETRNCRPEPLMIRVPASNGASKMRVRFQSCCFLLILGALLFVSPASATHHSSHRSSGSHGSSGSHRTARSHSHGKIHRSAVAKDRFREQHPCPSTGQTHGACRGYVIDHVKPLACGGADDPSNMQWQTTAAGKAKDRIERKGC